MPSVNLFRKQASIIIGDRQFNFPPFSIKFRLKYEYGSFTNITAQLYNPNDLTIGRCSRALVGDTEVRAPVRILAGYEGNFGAVADGTIGKWDVFRDDTNRILEIEINDADVWKDKRVKISARNVRASEVVALMLAQVGKPGVIDLGEDVFYKRFVFNKTAYELIENRIRIDTNSNYAFRNGILYMDPKVPVSQVPQQVLTYDSGLVGVPEKIERPRRKRRPAFQGYKIQTLFFFGLVLGAPVRVKADSADPNKSPLDVVGTIEKGNVKFSTFDDETSDYEVKLR
jgi:hypothetical protein